MKVWTVTYLSVPRSHLGVFSRNQWNFGVSYNLDDQLYISLDGRCCPQKRIRMMNERRSRQIYFDD